MQINEVGMAPVAAEASSPRAIEAALAPRCPNPDEVERLYQVRDVFVIKLKAKGSINELDLKDLDRLGRFKVADECWDLCVQSARDALLNDQHHHVRSCAALSSRRPKVAFQATSGEKECT